VIKFVSDLRQVGGFPRVLWFPPSKTLTNIVESGVKHYNSNPYNKKTLLFQLKRKLGADTWNRHMDTKKDTYAF